MGHRLGIAHHLPSFSRRLSSSSYTPSHSSPRSVHSSHIHIDSDLTTDSKDVLIERLNDLVSRLSNTHALDDGAVSAIHAQVDRIEGLVRDEERPHSHSLDERSASATPSSLVLGREEDGFWGPPSPSLGFMRIATPAPLPEPPTSPQTHTPPKKAMSTHRASQLAQEAESLAATLAATLSSLRARREESDHIHDLLLTRVEAATSRILFLEWRIAEMEDDFGANQSELKYLRIQLQAIEAQSVPACQDTVLVESIRSWKVDWEDIGKKSRARRGKYGVGGGSVVDELGGGLGEGSSVLSSVLSP